jgi:hypothetical protein
VLRTPDLRTPLLEAAASCRRLVLLGDVLELRHGPERDALAVAREPLTELGAALAPGCEVVIVPGNHDHHLLAAWLERRARSGLPPALGLETAVDWQPGEPLADLAGWLAPAKVRVSYPGVWLRPGVYAIHGHYADLHLTMPTIERLAAGVMGRIVRLPAEGPRNAEEYEAALAPVYAWIHALAQHVAPELGETLHGGPVRGWRALTGPGRRGIRRRAMAAGFPALIAALNRAGIGPLRPDLSGAALRRAGLRGMEAVRERLAIDARHVIFGHHGPARCRATISANGARARGRAWSTAAAGCRSRASSAPIPPVARTASGSASGSTTRARPSSRISWTGRGPPADPGLAPGGRGCSQAGTPLWTCQT